MQDIHPLEHLASLLPGFSFELSLTDEPGVVHLKVIRPGTSSAVEMTIESSELDAPLDRQALAQLVALRFGAIRLH